MGVYAAGVARGCVGRNAHLDGPLADGLLEMWAQSAPSAQRHPRLLWLLRSLSLMSYWLGFLLVRAQQSGPSATS
ncbi:hypothetical protein LMG29542_07965 [Paraburkholderia humisilvae]|uniref:Uncharacterized protein n=1 Tax=Paraburkholderia humisilvae TaxID=627669 RepID=A0A6J5FAU5_9BURK|nr:hypothetical protein LMG29542_07965 [Paraburkholderia humisilvae]